MFRVISSAEQNCIVLNVIFVTQGVGGDVNPPKCGGEKRLLAD